MLGSGGWANPEGERNHENVKAVTQTRDLRICCQGSGFHSSETLMVDTSMLSRPLYVMQVGILDEEER